MRDALFQASRAYKCESRAFYTAKRLRRARFQTMRQKAETLKTDI